jgi:hypothetical protein
MAVSPRDIGLDPFVWLQQSMPGDLWNRVAVVLEEVLGDERDGDPRLHRLLVRTMRADHEQRRERAS